MGPTLTAAERQSALPRATFLGPAACGDVARAARGRPAAIAVIDGYFHQRLAIWHKEILWAISQGSRVYGAASMGALRAAELADFGMIGVGQVFEWFRGGELEDDDEVAVVHDTAERGYLPRSDAMVNIRATMARAVESGVVSPATSGALIEAAKSIFFAQRSFAAMLDLFEARRGGLPELRALARWLQEPANRVDQKRCDALALLQRIDQDLAVTGSPAPPSFDFQYTEAWHELLRRL